MKNLLLSLLAFGALTPCANAQHQHKSELLFNGKNTEGWHTYLKPKAEAAWQVVDGTLQLDPKAEGQGDLVTDKEYENFELSLDWKIAEGGNSGVIFDIHEDPAFHATYTTGIEMQVLDNKNAEDNKKENHLAGSLYDMKAPSQNVAKPAGEWNAAKIRQQKGHLTFYLNNVKIVDTQIGSPEWQTLINDSKFKTWKNFAVYPKGHIALQDHGAQVSFKNIRITEL